MNSLANYAQLINSLIDKEYNLHYIFNIIR